jgi:hypothetical protein
MNASSFAASFASTFQNSKYNDAKVIDPKLISFERWACRHPNTEARRNHQSCPSGLPGQKGKGPAAQSAV